MKDISVCGANCTDCDYYQTCKGCNAVSGFVFYCGGKECPLHICCRENGFANCGQCAKLPCEAYLKMRDPRMTDEAFDASVNRRKLNLTELNNI